MEHRDTYLIVTAYLYYANLYLMYPGDFIKMLNSIGTGLNVVEELRY